MARTLILAGKIGPLFDGVDIEVGTPIVEYQYLHAANVKDMSWLMAIPYNAYQDAVAEHVNKETPISDVWSGNPDTDKYWSKG